MITVYVWPDGTWCEEYRDLVVMLNYMSDDYETLELTEEQYEQFVKEN